MHDYYTGLDPASFKVTLSVAVDGAAPGTDLSKKFAEVAKGVWELKLAAPVESLESGRITVEVKDRQGNTSRIERTFSIKPAR
jgi:hypothetical protein